MKVVYIIIVLELSYQPYCKYLPNCRSKTSNPASLITILVYRTSANIISSSSLGWTKEINAVIANQMCLINHFH